MQIERRRQHYANKTKLYFIRTDGQSRLMADRCYLGIALRKSVRCSFHILDTQRTMYKPVPNREVRHKGQIHSCVPNVVIEKINCL